VKKPLSEFAPAKRLVYCKPCKREYDRGYYARNSAKMLPEKAARNKVRREKIRKIIVEAKDKPCMDCGGRFPTCAMDFDHVNDDKIANVSALVAASSSLARIKTEIEKCELVCANCHRVRTESKNQYFGRSND
jgi:hypothetical protein